MGGQNCSRMLQLPVNSWEETVPESGGVHFHSVPPMGEGVFLGLLYDT